MDLRRIDLNLLVALEALLTERNVTRAAQRVFVGQPTMSTMLARLRGIFGDPLLVKQGRYLVATPFAESLIEPLQELLGQVEELVSRSPEFDPHTAKRTFSIMASDYIPPLFLQPLLDAFSREAPGIQLRFFAADSRADVHLRRGDIDLLIHPLDNFAGAEHFEHEVLFIEKYVIVADASNDLIGERVTESDLRSLPYLAMTIDSLPSFADTQLERLGIRPNRVVIASGAMGPFLIRGTQIITIAHESLAKSSAP